MMGLMLCLGYALMVNIVRPYSNESDFTLQIMCHTQLFITMFAALIIKAQVPFLGFSPHLRPIEATFCGWVVVLSHGFVCVWGLVGILHERFWSKEAIRLQAQKKKHAHDIKVRMSKFKRAKKKLITKVRAGAVFGGGGLAAFGLGGVDVTGGSTGNRKEGELEQKSSEQPSSSSMLLGALMVPGDNVLSVGGDASGVALEGVNGANGDVNFAWPGREADDPGAGDDLDSSENELDEDDESSDQHEGGGSGSDTESGLDDTDEEDEKEEGKRLGEKEGTEGKGDEEKEKENGGGDGEGDTDKGTDKDKDDTGNKKEEEEEEEENAGNEMMNEAEKKEDETQKAETVAVSSKTAEAEEEAAFNEAPKSVEAAKEAEKAKTGGEKKELTEAEKMVALSSDTSAGESSSEDSSSDDGAGF